MSCYSYVCWNFEQWLYDIDCVYVMLMEGSSREKTIQETLKHLPLAPTVFFQYNKGYKKCDKKLQHNKPHYDLCDANRTAFRHALDHGFRRILLLEDDCVFDDRIFQPTVIKDINSFLKENNPMIYNLGPFVCLPSPIDVLCQATHPRMLLSFSAHAVIYNEAYMRQFTTCLLGHTDATHNRYWDKFTYHQPLAYQLVQPTDNSREGWGYVYPVVDLLVVKPFGIDRAVQPGYDRLRIVCNLFSLFLFLLILSYLLSFYKSKVGV